MSTAPVSKYQLHGKITHENLLKVEAALDANGIPNPAPEDSSVPTYVQARAYVMPEAELNQAAKPALPEDTADADETKPVIRTVPRWEDKVNGARVRLSFKAGALSQAIAVSCKETGIMGTLNMPALPIAFDYVHPLALLSNVNNLIKTCKDDNKPLKKLLERQVLAGIVVTQLKGLKLTPKESKLSGAEKNLLLQSCGAIMLDYCARFFYKAQHSPLFELHKTNYTLPTFSYEWASKDATANTFAAAFLSYVKEIRNNLDPDYIERERIANIRMSYVPGQRPEEVYNPLKKLKMLSKVGTHKRERKLFKELQTEAILILEDLSVLMDKELAKLIGHLVKNMHHGLSTEHARLGSAKLFLTFGTTVPDAKRLGQLLEACLPKASQFLLESVADEASPKPYKSLAEILAEKKALAASIVTEMDAPSQEASDGLESPDEEQSEAETEEIDADEETLQSVDTFMEQRSVERRMKGETK